MFPLPDLQASTLEVLEKRLIRVCAKELSRATLDNQRDLYSRVSSPVEREGIYPDLDRLLDIIFRFITSGMEPSWNHPKKLYPTHSLGTSEGEVYGLATQRGGWTYLLPGSRILSNYPNYRTLAKNPAALARLEGFYRRGLIAWRPKTNNRPAGLCFTEPVLFRNMLIAARVLYAGAPAVETWSRLTRPRNGPPSAADRRLLLMHNR